MPGHILSRMQFQVGIHQNSLVLITTSQLPNTHTINYSYVYVHRYTLYISHYYYIPRLVSVWGTRYPWLTNASTMNTAFT